MYLCDIYIIYIYNMCMIYPYLNDFVPGIQMTYEENELQYNILQYNAIVLYNDISHNSIV